MSTDRLRDLVADIRALVECESPSHDLGAVARCAQVLGEIGRDRLGRDPELLVSEGVHHLRWRFGTGPSRILVLGHLDTVWPVGTLAARPFSADRGLLRGPGVLDMKAGLAIAIHALAELRPAARDGITLLLTGDEEVGSLTSRAVIEEEARGCAAVLVLEAGADDGSLKVARKGVSTYVLDIEGRAAHAGLEPESGVNATIVLAELVLAAAALADPAAGTTVTPTVADAGSTANTVPDHARLTIDVRAWTESEQQRVDNALRALRPSIRGAGLRLGGGVNRPPLEERASRRLAQRAADVARDLGQPVPGGVAVGGGSDGNFTAAVGAPTLDGLGAVGGGAHAANEHVRMESLSPRTDLVLGLVDGLLGVHSEGSRP